jgi:hypothetical protein
MSRSLRKTPIFGHTTARSEADDKRLWHKRWRASERDQLATVGADTDHVTGPSKCRIKHLGYGQGWQGMV